ncbi:MAG: polysaccharide pyruvyl transferase CsaB [Oscillospiraceae bacterium]|nr:polysaccharide pyruvyl transferase CsaB [Oscillospiraceae bacterium]
MKIIHMISGGDVGGAKTHVLSLLAGLSKTEQARLVCFTEGDFAKEARELGIDTLVLEEGLTSVVRKLRRMIRDEGFEIVHCHGSRANMIGSLLRKTISAPVITTVHSDYRLDYLGRPLGRLVYGTINTVSLRFLSYYVGVSDAMCDLLISRGFDPQRMFSIYNGVDFSPRTPSLDRAEYLESVGHADWQSCVVCGIAARFSAVKDVATLIRGFALAVKDCPNLRLLIAGDGEQRKELESLAAQLCPEETYCFAGWVSDMDSFYNALDINTLTSLSETFPYALTEGARMRCATIASNVGGVPYLIEDGVCGMLFAATDEKMLASHLKTLASDEALRNKLGDALYEKASRDFSVDATVRRQIEIYQTILRRSVRKRKRDGVLICGAYGRGNAGDDAILEAIVGQMRSIDPNIPLYVLSRTPKQTSARHRVGSVYTFRFLHFCRVARKTALYINGGGSLIQDVTSSRSLWYYLLNIWAAKKLGNRVLMYGCGIGPVHRASNRRHAGRIIDRCADVITLRDNFSMEEIRRMNITKPEVHLTADPAFLLTGAPEDAANAFLQRYGIERGEEIAFFAIRGWRGMEAAAPAIAEAAKKTAAEHGLRPVFLAMEPHSDLAICRLCAELCGEKSVVLSSPDSSSLLIALMRRASLVVAMRLHALVFAAAVGTPLTGISYDPKVTAFLDYLGREACPSVESVTAERLLSDIDFALSAADQAAEKAEELRCRSAENQALAKRMLEA